MAVIAKFVCEKVKDGEVTLRTVYDSNPDSENGRFFKYTPWGELKMGVVNDLALSQFEEGKEYFITFEKANNE